MARTIEVIVKPDGYLAINAVGFKGADCEKATAFLEKALGQMRKRHPKAEFYQPVRQQQKIGS